MELNKRGSILLKMVGSKDHETKKTIKFLEHGKFLSYLNGDVLMNLKVIEGL